MKKLIAISFLFLFSCATFTQDTYRILTVSNEAYDTVMTTLGDLYLEKLITEEQKEEIIKIADEYTMYHNLAVDQYYDYVAGINNKKPDLELMTKKLAELLRLARIMGYKYE